MRRLLSVLFLALLTLPSPALAQDPAEVTIGERLFLETRFAQYFAATSTSVNAAPPAGDPVMDTTVTSNGPIPGPFAGQSMNCRACHLVDDAKATPGGGNRSYADFAPQSLVPARDDGHTTTPRNSPSLVDATLPRNRPFLLHFDGEFASTAALVRGTLTGRNYGWLPSEVGAAVQHVARVIREDDGSGQLAQSFGGSYASVLGGTDSTIPPGFILPRRFRIDVTRASDDAIVKAVSRLIAAYVESLTLANENGTFTDSPYDLFLAVNHILPGPDFFEAPEAYRARLRRDVAEIVTPVFVSDAEDGPFMLHNQPFQFGRQELEGLRIFLDPARGNCASCHVPPLFTDFALHNTGVTQLDYDAVHGAGAFGTLAIPDLAAREADPNAFLPATAAHPLAQEPFRAQVESTLPQLTDLGIWNIYRNADFDDSNHQRRLDRLVCRSLARPSQCRQRSSSDRLASSIALFKTPGLRDLGHSEPYLHSGTADTLTEVVQRYVQASRLAQSGQLRNGAHQLRQMQIDDGDVAPLVAFLQALNQDYE